MARQGERHGWRRIQKYRDIFFTHIVHDVRLRQLTLCKIAVLLFCEQFYLMFLKAFYTDVKTKTRLASGFLSSIT
jgi:hypothetical protein